MTCKSKPQNSVLWHHCKNWCRFLELWGMIQMDFYQFPSSHTQYTFSQNLLNFHMLLKARFEVISVTQKRYLNSVWRRKLDVLFHIFQAFPVILFSFHAFIRSLLSPGYVLILRITEVFKPVCCLLLYYIQSLILSPMFLAGKPLPNIFQVFSGKIFFFKCQSFKTFLDPMMFFSSIHLIKLASTEEA